MAFGTKNTWQDFDAYFEENTYTFFKDDEAFNRESQKKEKENNSVTIIIVGYQKNESYQVPFLSFLLTQQTGAFQFPRFTYRPTLDTNTSTNTSTTTNTASQQTQQKYLIDLFLSRLTDKLFEPNHPNAGNTLQKKILVLDTESVNKKKKKNPSTLAFSVERNLLYVFVDFTPLKVKSVYFSRRVNKLWFCLPDEIMNVKHVCNIPIHEETTDFFLKYPDLLFLYETNPTQMQLKQKKEMVDEDDDEDEDKDEDEDEDDDENKDEKNIQPLETPVVLYAGSNEKTLYFQYMFGKFLQNDPRFGRVFCFTDFPHAVREGGWSKNYEPEYKYNKRITDDHSRGKYKKGGILRFAVFLGNSLYLAPSEAEVSTVIATNATTATEHLLQLQDTFHPCFEFRESENTNTITNSDMEDSPSKETFASVMQLPFYFVKNYQLQVALTYHFIEKESLGDVFDAKDEKKYQIK